MLDPVSDSGTVEVIDAARRVDRLLLRLGDDLQLEIDGVVTPLPHVADGRRS